MKIIDKLKISTLAGWTFITVLLAFALASPYLPHTVVHAQTQADSGFSRAAAWVNLPNTFTASPQTITAVRPQVVLIDTTPDPGESPREGYHRVSIENRSGVLFIDAGAVQVVAVELPGGVLVSSGPSAPAGNCRPGSLFTNTSGIPNTLYVCQRSAREESGTWSGK